MSKKDTPYFKNVAVGHNIYSVVYGSGQVIFMVNPRDRMEGFYTFEVEFKTGDKIFYTDDGVPNWCHGAKDCQTIWYKDDIDLFEEDISPTNNILAKKRILKLRVKNKLEMKCPTGIWRDVIMCPERIIIQAVSNEKWHLFREKEE